MATQVVEPRPQLARPPRESRAVVSKLAPVLVVLAVWELVTVTGVFADDVMPSAHAALGELVRLVVSGESWPALSQTLAAWGLGFAIGGVLAVVAGSLIGLSGFAYAAAWPVIELLKTVPAITIVPLAIVVYGATLQMKVVVVVFAVFWPLAIQAMYGVRSIDPVARDAADAMGLRGVRRFLWLTLPSASPFLATGLRVAAAVALVMCIIAELIGGAAGLGQAITVTVNAGPSRLDSTYAYILLTGLVGVLLTSGVRLAERLLMAWHETHRVGRSS